MTLRSAAFVFPMLSALLAICLGPSTAALAETPAGYSSEELSSEEDPLRVTGGVDAKTCAWPTVVYLKTAFPGKPGSYAQCTGTLVHPEIILYAAHCGKAVEVVFGENRVKGQKLVQADFAKNEVNPRYKKVTDQAIDWAYIRLKKPLTGVPMTPIAAGCELAKLQKNRGAVTFVGFSPNNSKQASAVKLRWANTRIKNVSTGQVTAGGARVTACGGDSGGPLMAQLEDGSWRTIGIASTLAGGCGSSNGYNTYSMVRRSLVDWVSKRSGIDITPCYDLSGKPTPSVECDKWMAFKGDPKSPKGTRPNKCNEADKVFAKDACGVPDSGKSEDDSSSGDTGSTSSDKDSDSSTSSGGDSSESSTEDKSSEDKSSEDTSSDDTTESSSEEKSSEEEPSSEDSSEAPGDDESSSEKDSESDSEDDDADDSSSDEDDEPKQKDKGKVVIRNRGCSVGFESGSSGGLLALAGLAWVFIRRKERRS